ncbi:hypothetical protein IGK74_002452 [Enterococcus sp. AZ150]|uniref:hypothetical protein n=1 Tax=Enterococcus sp. AZ150 TaxID=2774866 RepID=UPI003F225A12
MKKTIMEITMILFLGILGGCFDSRTEPTAEQKISSLKDENKKLKSELHNEKIKNNSATMKKQEVVGLNQDVIVEGKSKEQASVKITEVTTEPDHFPNEMINPDSDYYDINHMIAVTIEYKNLSMSSPFTPNISYFKAYTIENQPLEVANLLLGTTAVDKGESNKRQLFFITPGPSSELNEIKIDLFIKSKVATFDLQVSH